MNKEEFEEVAAGVIEGLPEEFADRLENIAVMVEDEPTAEQLASVNIERGASLLGLFEGLPMTDRYGYSVTMPARITLFKKPIERVGRSRSGIEKEIERVLKHEIAHYFGIGDARLDELGR